MGFQGNVPAADNVAPYVGAADSLFKSFSTGRRLASTLFALSDEPIKPAKLERNFNDVLILDGQSDLLLPKGTLRHLFSDLPAFEPVVNPNTSKTVAFEPNVGGREILAPTAANVGALCLVYSVAPVELVGQWSRRNAQHTEAPPYSRLALYFRLLAEKPGQTVPTKELDGETGLTPKTIYGHIKPLLSANIIFSEGEQVYEYGSYALSPKNCHPEETAHTLQSASWGGYKHGIAAAIIDTFRHVDDSGISIHELWRLIVSKPQSEDLFRSQRPSVQRKQVNKIVLWLVDNGVAISTKSPEVRVKKVGLTEKGRDFIQSYIQILDEGLNENYQGITRGTDLGLRLGRTKANLAWLLKADFTVGKVATRAPLSIRRAQIEALYEGDETLALSTDTIASAIGTRETTTRILYGLGFQPAKVGRRQLWLPARQED